MRTIRSTLLCGTLVAIFVAACQREATAPETTSAPTREPSTDATTTPSIPAATTATAPEVGAPANTLVLFTSGAPRPFLADASNRAVYYVEGDSDGSKCTGPCTDAWPPVLAAQASP